MTNATGSRSALQLLRDPVAGWFFVGKLLSVSGMWIQNIAAAILMFELTGSALMVGAVSMAQFMGPLLLGLWTGALSDRADRRKVLLVTRLSSGVVIGSMAVLDRTGLLAQSFGPWLLIGALLVLGVTMAVAMPAMQSIVPGLVPREDLEGAIALSSAAPSLARTVGPAVGAGLIVLGGPALAFATAATCHFVFVVVLLRLQITRPPRPNDRPRLLGGLHYVRGNLQVRRALLAVAVLGVGADAAVTLVPSVAASVGGDAGTVGVLASLFGAGALLSVTALNQLRRFLELRTIGMVGFGVVAGGLCLAAAGTAVGVIGIGMTLIGIGTMLATVTMNTTIMGQVPDELRGRVMALWGVAFAGARPPSALINGAIADLVSVRAAFLVAAAITASGLLLARGTGQPRTTEP